MGISAGGLAASDKIYSLYWWEGITTPGCNLTRAIRKAIEVKVLQSAWKPTKVAIRGNLFYARSLASVKRKRCAVKYPLKVCQDRMAVFYWDKAGAGYGSRLKRNFKMLVDYEHGKVIHVLSAYGD